MFKYVAVLVFLKKIVLNWLQIYLIIMIKMQGFKSVTIVNSFDIFVKFFDVKFFVFENVM